MFLNWKEDNRPAKHGWWPGGYIGRCRCCNDTFVGSKGAYHCADCAYDFDEQLEYERLWREVGWQYSLVWVYKKVGLLIKEKTR